MPTSNRHSPRPNPARYHFQSDPACIGDVIADVLSNSQLQPLSDDDISKLEIILAEVINNIAEHAYGERSDGPIEMSADREGDRMVLTFSDTGIPMPDGKSPEGSPQNLDCPTDELPEGGFGWFLIRLLCKDVHYERLGNKNCLALFVDLDPRPT